MKTSKVKWSLQEDRLLLNMLEDGKTYADISRLLQNRSTLQIRMHHTILRSKVDNEDCAKSFGLEDDWKLMEAIAAKGRAWKTISQEFFHGSKTPSQLCMRWRTLSSLLLVSTDTRMLYQRLKTMHSLSKKTRDKALHSAMEERLGMLFPPRETHKGQRSHILSNTKMCGHRVHEPSTKNLSKGDFEINPAKTEQECACPSPIMLMAEDGTYTRPNLPNIVRQTRLLDSSFKDKGLQYCIYDDPSIVATENKEGDKHSQYSYAWQNYLKRKSESSSYWASIVDQKNDLLTRLIGSLREFATSAHDYSLMQMRTSVRLWLCYMKPVPNTYPSCSTRLWRVNESFNSIENMMPVA
ncbi:hypothetical protein XU18_2140 [Perkinsela sp. CCAP 1560/4]|nr:hypothetical protein XU18_2140 [Perkinsela sp. CCAP 1560/4]|eukprot:KNH07164.1 hypothetical protein XU18_2140 [Perkinsela sp. CCAP 1560/4]